MNLLNQNLKKDIILLKLLKRQVYNSSKNEELLDPDKFVFNGKKICLQIDDYPGDYLIIEPDKIRSTRAESTRDDYTDFYINHDITNDNPLKFSFSGKFDMPDTIDGKMNIKEEILNNGITKYMPSIELSGYHYDLYNTPPHYNFSFKNGIFNFSISIGDKCEMVIINIYPKCNQNFITYSYHAGLTHKLSFEIGLRLNEYYYQIYQKMGCDEKEHTDILRDEYYNDSYTESLKDILNYFNEISNYQKLIKEINIVYRYFLNRFLGISTEDYSDEEIIDIFGIKRVKMEYPNRVKSLDKFMIGKNKVRKRVK